MNKQAESQELYEAFQEDVWDNLYNFMHDGFKHYSEDWEIAFAEASQHPDVKTALLHLMNQDGVHSVLALRDRFKHLCAKAHANVNVNNEVARLWAIRETF